MSEYPEALLEKVARGLFTGILHGGDDGGWNDLPPLEVKDSYRRLWRCAAQDALDALGLREEERHAGRWIHPDAYRLDKDQRRYVTDWETRD